LGSDRQPYARRGQTDTELEPTLGVQTLELAKRVHLIRIAIDAPLISKIDIFSVYFYTSYFPVRTVIKLYSGTFVFIVV
jgi:hypothetical protein